MNVITATKLTAYSSTPQEDPGTPAIVMGNKVTGMGIRDPHGLRKYIYVQNGDASGAWSVGNIVRQQCVNPGNTEGTREGTLLTADADSTGLTSIQDDAHGETVDSSWKVWASYGEVQNVLAYATNSITLVSSLTTALANTYPYGVYKPWRMVTVTKNTVLAVAGVAMSATPYGQYGWIQVYGFGLALADNAGNSVALAHGGTLEISTGTDGCVMGGMGSDEDMPFGFSLITSTETGTAFLAPVFLNTPMAW